MKLFANLFSSSAPSANLKDVITDGAFLVDVRTEGEFAQGKVNGSVNIPLDRVPFELAKFMNKKNIIVFCRSGARSGRAKNILEQYGFTNVINGGTWEEVNQIVK
ncbi:MAG: rhodanese-like domain-containing protein [Ginsengibacter sp.]